MVLMCVAVRLSPLVSNVDVYFNRKAFVSYQFFFSWYLIVFKNKYALRYNNHSMESSKAVCWTSIENHHYNSFHNYRGPPTE